MGLTEVTQNIGKFLLSDERDPEIYPKLRSVLSKDRALHSELTDIAGRLANDPSALGKRLSKAAARGRRGIALWLLGRAEDAEKEMTEAGEKGEAGLELGWCRLDIGLYDRAVEALDEVQENAPDNRTAALLKAEAHTRAGGSHVALKDIEKLIKEDATAEAYYQKGLALDGEARHAEAVEAYEKALEIDPDHYRAVFRLGYTYVLADDPEKAMGHFKRLAELEQLYPAALINLGLLYEDADEIDKALECYKRVLDANPQHARAKLYYRDAAAATDMFYDPEEQKERTRKDEVLNTPITDFELSVRSRNCLAKMNILTLGDLVAKTEEELLAYKNFGETSLEEIKDILQMKGLTLGDEDEEAEDHEPGPAEAADAPQKRQTSAAESDSDDVFAKTTEDLDLSVRCRRCLERLNIETIRDLVQVTEDELLSVRNFGRTSLEEIKEALAANGLALSDGSSRDE